MGCAQSNGENSVSSARSRRIGLVAKKSRASSPRGSPKVNCELTVGVEEDERSKDSSVRTMSKYEMQRQELEELFEDIEDDSNCPEKLRNPGESPKQKRQFYVKMNRHNMIHSSPLQRQSLSARSSANASPNPENSPLRTPVRSEAPQWDLAQLDDYLYHPRRASNVSTASNLSQSDRRAQPVDCLDGSSVLSPPEFRAAPPSFSFLRPGGISRDHSASLDFGCEGDVLGYISPTVSQTGQSPTIRSPGQSPTIRSPGLFHSPSFPLTIAQSTSFRSNGEPESLRGGVEMTEATRVNRMDSLSNSVKLICQKKQVSFVLETEISRLMTNMSHSESLATPIAYKAYQQQQRQTVTKRLGACSPPPGSLSPIEWWGPGKGSPMRQWLSLADDQQEDEECMAGVNSLQPIPKPVPPLHCHLTPTPPSAEKLEGAAHRPSPLSATHDESSSSSTPSTPHSTPKKTFSSRLSTQMRFKECWSGSAVMHSAPKLSPARRQDDDEIIFGKSKVISRGGRKNK